MDKFFVEIDRDASSPNPQVAIWKGQHVCVSENTRALVQIPTSERCGEIIIKHQLAGDRGHYSVLNCAFVKFNCFGFPHDVVAQITRHSQSRFLVQSNRYTGMRFLKVASGELDVEDCFYLRPVGEYRDREGRVYFYDEEEREIDKKIIHFLCQRYAQKVNNNCPFELARELLAYSFRQDFTIMGSLQTVWHYLDQRSKKDAQLEIQKFAELVMKCLDDYTPELSAWYRNNRWGKAKLAP